MVQIRGAERTAKLARTSKTVVLFLEEQAEIGDSSDCSMNASASKESI
jgi:hypothetical protein